FRGEFTCNSVPCGRRNRHPCGHCCRSPLQDSSRQPRRTQVSALHSLAPLEVQAMAPVTNRLSSVAVNTVSDLGPNKEAQRQELIAGGSRVGPTATGGGSNSTHLNSRIDTTSKGVQGEYSVW